MTRLLLILSLALLLATACGGKNVTPTATPLAPGGTLSPFTNTRAAALRTGLNNLLRDHVYLAGIAISAAANNRADEFQAAAKTLDKNSVAMSKAIEAVYGAEAGAQFLAGWRSHIGMFISYTDGLNKGDDAARDKARADLAAYRKSADAFFSKANPNIPAGLVEQTLAPHVSYLLAVCDAQWSQNHQQTYDQLKAGADQTQMIGDFLSSAIVKQFHEKFQ